MSAPTSRRTIPMTKTPKPAPETGKRRGRKAAASLADANTPPTHAVTVPAAPKGKIEMLVGLLRQEGGATIEAMSVATGWQIHSVRGAISGAIKKKLGLTVTSEKTDGR